MAVFISYSHQDAAVVEPLALQLVKQNVKVWRDVWRNAVGEDFATAVRDALAGASSGQPQVEANLRITTLGSGPSDSLVFNGGALFEQICRASGISLNVDEAGAL